MKRIATLIAFSTLLATAAPALAQDINTPENVGPTRYETQWNGYYVDGPYAYAPGEAYAYAPRRGSVYDPNFYGYWDNGRYGQCTQSYTPNRPDRSAGGSNVTEQCF